MRPELLLDWKNPDFDPIFAARAKRLTALRADSMLLRAMRRYYKENPADFINDWAVTVDPRVSGKGRHPVMPFVLMPKQREQIEYILRKWRAGDPGVIKKSRDVGASWVFMALGCTLCLFYDDMHIGVGSAKEDKVDRSGDPDTLFYKGRMFLRYLPPEFRNGWDDKKNSAHMRLTFPGTGSSFTGEAGDNIGRGGRKAIYGVDESAFVERPMLIEASLAATTDCRIDISSVNGMANPFAEKCHSGKFDVFTFHWRDDPRKDDAWYAKKCDELDPVVVASELDLNFTASTEGQIIPSAHVQAAIDAHKKLKLPEPTGQRRAAYDVADRGKDKCAMAFRHAYLLEDVVQWSGKLEDLYGSAERAFHEVDLRPPHTEFDYDADGLGANVRGDARKINEAREETAQIKVGIYRGSAAVLDPEKIVPRTMRKAKDFFENYKAQCWWSLKYRFEATYNAVVKGHAFDPGDIISISSTVKELPRLISELSQPCWDRSKLGKVMVDKTPDDALSPNLADAVMMVFAPRRISWNVPAELL